MIENILNSICSSCVSFVNRIDEKLKYFVCGVFYLINTIFCFLEKGVGTFIGFILVFILLKYVYLFIKEIKEV